MEEYLLIHHEVREYYFIGHHVDDSPFFDFLVLPDLIDQAPRHISMVVWSQFNNYVFK